MKEFYEDLDKLENINSHIDKAKHLHYLLYNYLEAEVFFRFAFNDVVYGVNEKTFYSALDLSTRESHVSEAIFSKFKTNSEEILPVEKLISFATKISINSGYAQQLIIKEICEKMNPIQAVWFCKAILHDLRCGVQVKTINSVFKERGLPLIKKFSLQLAKKLDIDDDNEVYKKVKFPCSMETKYDGIRIQADIYTTETDETEVRLTSRRGKDRTDAHPEIVQALKETFEDENIILDGEVVADSFQKLTRKNDTSTRRFVIWDLLNDEKLIYKSRWDNLINLLENKGITENLYSLNNNINKLNNETADPLLLRAEHYNCNNIEELREFYNDINRRKEEGVMVKLDHAIYKRGSRNNMFKIKKVYTADLRIYGYELGEGKRHNKVATLKLMDSTGQLLVDVGSGIDDETCDDLTDEVNEHMQGGGGHETDIPFIGKICEIKYNELTETGSIRFPRFICIRDDKINPDDMKDLVTR